MAGLAFDEHQFQRKVYPISARYEAGEVITTQIDFGDYVKMSVQSHKPFEGRRGPTPRWALDDRFTRMVILRYVLRRYGLRKELDGTPQEQLAHIRPVAERQMQFLIAIAQRLSKEYVTLKNRNRRWRDRNSGKFICREARERRIDVLASEIEGLDRQLMINTNAPAKAAALVVLYYRMGYNSVECGTELNLSPPGCRQILCRLPPACCARRELPQGRHRRMDGANLAPSAIPSISRKVPQ